MTIDNINIMLDDIFFRFIGENKVIPFQGEREERRMINLVAFEMHTKFYSTLLWSLLLQ